VLAGAGVAAAGPGVLAAATGVLAGAGLAVAGVPAAAGAAVFCWPLIRLLLVASTPT
jgi:hypothetical protein